MESKLDSNYWNPIFHPSWIPTIGFQNGIQNGFQVGIQNGIQISEDGPANHVPQKVPLGSWGHFRHAAQTKIPLDVFLAGPEELVR